MKKLSIDGRRFIDEDGAEVILHGVNLVCKDKAKGYVSECDEGLFAWFRGQGYNVIRLGLIWDSVEPEPGVYDDAYLSRIKQQAEWAANNGIYVFLDMHQDLYSLMFGDGAPAWATLTDDLPHVEGNLWSDAYLESPAVNRALDHFWSNSPAPDGIGLQDHYAAMWCHAAQYFADCPNLIGFDMMNEPYPGSGGQEVLGTIVAAYASSVLGIAEADSAQLAELWFDEEKKLEILSGMADMEIYSKLVDCARDVSQRFEQEWLASFFDKTAEAIRSVDKDRFLLLETSYFSNMGIESGLEPVKAKSGDIDQACVYAPHGYDLVVDTEHYDVYNQDRVDLIFAAHRRVQERLSIPVLVGEWGAFSGHPSTFGLTKAIVALFEGYLWSETYWCWTDGFKESPYARGLNRAYPQATGGVLASYRYDYEAERLEMEYVPRGGETRIYHPHVSNLSLADVDVRGTDASWEVELHPYVDAEGGLVVVRVPFGESPVTICVGGKSGDLV